MRRVEDQAKLNLVFFDFMGFFMVVYRVSVATAVNVLIIVLCFIDMIVKARSLGVPLKAKLFLTLKALIVMLISLVCASVTCTLIAAVLDLFGATMSWYRSPYLIAGLYGSSSVAVILLVHWILAKQQKNQREKWLQEDVYFDAARLIWVFLLIVLELAKINSSFICCAWVLFPTLVRGVLGNLLNLTSFKGTRESHMFTHFIMQIIPLSLLFYCVWSMYTVFVPIMGRIGAMHNPDVLVGMFTTILVFLSTSYMFSLVRVMSSIRKVLMLLLCIFGVTFLLVCFTPLGFPYSGEEDSPVPMRLYVLHTERKFYNMTEHVVSEDSGYWIVPLDYNGPKMLKKFIDEVRNAEPIDCDAELACGMPFYMPVISLLRLSYYVSAPKPKIHGHHKFEMTSKALVSSQIYRLSFSASGPDHMTVVISPRSGITLPKWSLTSDTPLRSLDWRDRPTYFIYYSYGEYKEPWKFSIDLKVPNSYDKNSPLVDISFITHYLHGHDYITGDFPSFLARIPSWIHATPWTCTLDMFVF
ncbi:Endoplasmic reticulum metallopeptidase 1, partial [Stegodyphus mimosarum]